MVRIGLIGVGYWGPNIARSFELTGGAEIRWICDLDPERLQRMVEKHPRAEPTTDFADLLADSELDAVAISTPTVTHFDIARRALEAGKHVLVEKPITRTAAQAEQLIGLAAGNGLTLMVGHVFEYNETIRALKARIDDGELGSIYYIDFERTNLGPVRTDVNALMDLASHDISIMCYLMGSSPSTVTARGRSYLNPGIEDTVFATFGFDNGTLAHVHASWLNPRKVRQITVVGSKKMAVCDDLDLKQPIQIFDKHIAEPDELPDTYLDYKTVIVEGETTIPKIVLNQPLLTECQHFIDCIRTGRTPQSDGASGLRVARALEAAMESMKNESRIVRIAVN